MVQNAPFFRVILPWTQDGTLGEVLVNISSRKPVITETSAFLKGRQSRLHNSSRRSPLGMTSSLPGFFECSPIKRSRLRDRLFCPFSCLSLRGRGTFGLLPLLLFFSRLSALFQTCCPPFFFSGVRQSFRKGMSGLFARSEHFGCE